uniref:Uncharacterized protein n=2 Tax=Cacopsylla melanoneura TaxID=428564 RepID=A0A8D8PYR4_9HEMI
MSREIYRFNLSCGNNLLPQCFFSYIILLCYAIVIICPLLPDLLRTENENNIGNGYSLEDGNFPIHIPSQQEIPTRGKLLGKRSIVVGLVNHGKSLNYTPNGRKKITK